MDATFSSDDFRNALRNYPTGVCAITATHERRPIGMVVGSFTSVSLEPPLVGFLPDKKSTTWPKIVAAKQFCVNVLAADQENICRALSSKREDKFSELSFRISEAGHPVLHGVLAWLECQIYAVHESGDHYIAIGKVDRLDACRIGLPLIFFQGSYGVFQGIETDAL